MIPSIQGLMNMEMALYGGFGSNAVAPSYLNNYQGSYNVGGAYNPAFYGYGTNFGQNIPSQYAQANSTTNNTANNSVFTGLNEKETKALVDSYVEGLTPSESLLGCAASSAAFGVVMHPRLIAHPWNSINTSFFNKDFKNMFADVKKEGSTLARLWNNKMPGAVGDTNNLLREAYFQMHKAESRMAGWKIGAFRKRYTGADLEAVQKVKQELQHALKSGCEKDIANATAKLQQAYASDGFIASGWKSVKGFLGFSPDKRTIAQRLDMNNATVKKEVKSKVSKLLEKPAKTYTDFLKKGGGVKGGLFFMAIEFALSFGKISEAFKKDNQTGMKQLGQTTVKAAGNAAGWALGEAAGAMLFAKYGAAIGTAFGPGIGTAIGGLVGLIGGSIGMMLAGKLTKKLVGNDVGEKVIAENKIKTQEGQIEILQSIEQNIKNGKEANPFVRQAFQKAIDVYA